MNNLKIGIVEDNLLIAESLHDTLTQIGYTPTPPARSYDEAIAMIQQHSPDLLFIDIIIEGQQDGIDLAETVKKDYNLPFIFLTANSDPQTVNRAKQVAPYAYLVKPFNEADLFSSIEIAFGKFCNEQTNDLTDAKTKNYLKNMLFVKDGELFHKLAIEGNRVHRK
jgi:two-component system response regulator LytT